MDYRNKICDGCGQPLREGEDIVVCPECATPQHRACYEQHHACVNADRHSDGFVWHAADAATSPEETVKIPCPVCGFENDAHAVRCARCDQPFTSDAPEPSQPRREIRTEELVNSIFFDAPTAETELQLDDDEKQQVEFVISQRALAATPGMTEAQAQEQLCGHPIRQVMTFLSSKALTYVGKFRALEGGKKLTWNWAAFFLSPYWFFYRKLYKPGIIFLTIRICLTLAVYTPLTQISEVLTNLSAAAQSGTLTQEMYAAAVQQLSSSSLPMYIALGVLLVLAVLSGLLADRLYHSYIGSTLTEAKEQESRDAFMVFFLRKSAVSPFAAVLSYAAISVIPNLIMTFIVR